MGKGITTHEKTNLLTKHLQTALGHRKPHSVHSVSVFCNFKSVFSPATDVSPLIPLEFLRCDTSNARAADATWVPIPNAGVSRPLRFSSVHGPCREHCRALVQAFRVWQARIKQCRAPSGERRLQGTLQTLSSTSSPPGPAVSLDILMQIEVNAARADRQAHLNQAKKTKKNLVEVSPRMTSLHQHPSLRRLVSQHSLGPSRPRSLPSSLVPSLASSEVFLSSYVVVLSDYYKLLSGASAACPAGGRPWTCILVMMLKRHPREISAQRLSLRLLPKKRHCTVYKRRLCFKKIQLHQHFYMCISVSVDIVYISGFISRCICIRRCKQISNVGIFLNS